MKKSLSLLAFVALLASSVPVHAGDVKNEEAFDRAAGLFKRSWRPPTANLVRKRFPTPTPPQVLPGLPPWSQQPQGAQTPPPTIITIIGPN
ncbi:MAG TPA: hypothetical protein DCP71_13020 [Verrucomicrobiales bacterium]|nr:hypothetical protein [Verrucomicrobiales bacterium]